MTVTDEMEKHIRFTDGTAAEYGFDRESFRADIVLEMDEVTVQRLRK